MALLIFIPLLLGSVVGLAFILMLWERIYRMPVDDPDRLNAVAQNLAIGDRAKALFLLEEDNHPISSLLAFIFNLSTKSTQEMNDAYEYGIVETEKKLTSGVPTLGWLALVVPLSTVLTWLGLHLAKYIIAPQIIMVLVLAIPIQAIFFIMTQFTLQMRIKAIKNRADDHFRFLSGLFLNLDEKTTDLGGLIDDTQDVVEISDRAKKAK